MEEIRKNHNEAKRDLIQSVTNEGAHILDVGCGFGGDLQKWHKCGANINMCDPEPTALEEARARAKICTCVSTFIRVIFTTVQIESLMWCVSLFLHYIFQTRDLFLSSLREIKNRIKCGGMLIGIIPDSEKIIFKTPLVDDMGNFFKMKDHGNGGFGEKLFVHLEDTPYYADGPKSEPIAYKDHLVTQLEHIGFKLQLWEGLTGNPISELYSKFIFVYDR